MLLLYDELTELVNLAYLYRLQCNAIIFKNCSEFNMCNAVQLWAVMTFNKTHKKY